MQRLTLVHSVPAPTPAPGFNSRDLIALTCWMQEADSHGYRRVLIEGGPADLETEQGAYVLIYMPDHDWATWGIARDEDAVIVWQCGTGIDLGRFATMVEALESLPPIWAAPVAATPSRKRETAVRPRPRLALVHSC